MKKQTLVIILIAMLVVSCLALTACHSCEFGEWTVATPATCTEIGQEKRVCECGEFEVRDIPATGHTFGEWKIVENSTCTELGQEERVCACGEKEVRDISLAKHTYGDWTEVKAPTCTETGLELRYCTCGNTETRVIEPTGHSHEAVVTNPTCTAQGYTTHTCHCGDSFVDNYVDALGHTEGSVVVENNVDPTCTVAGSYDNVVYCTVCKAELSRDTVVVPALGHTEGSVVVENNVDPTCTVDGSYDNVVYCTVCKAELSRDTVVVPALGHDEVPHDAKAPTCTEIGWDAYVTCSRCDYSTYNEIPATGHTEGEWIIDLEPNCTSGGRKYQVCATCEGIINLANIPSTGHSHEAVVTPPTCTEQGYTTHTCSNCGDSYIDTYVEALGHNFQESDNCSNCGQSIANVAVATYDMSKTSDDNVKGYAVARPDGNYDAYIKGVGAMRDYSSSPFYVDGYTPINAYIGNGVTSIGSVVFFECSSLTSITIPSSVTSIGEHAFLWCRSLANITIEGSPQIGDGAFSYSAYYDNEDNWQNKVLYIDNCLIEAKNTIDTCTIKEGTTSVADNAFSGCDNLTSVIIPDSVTSIGQNAFSGCSSLESIIIPTNVTSIGIWAFSDCYELTSVTFEEGSQLTSIEYYTFARCSSLSNITIPSGVTSIGNGAFDDCTSLTSITIPNSVTGIGDWAFAGCTSLTSITIPDSVTSIGNYAFDGCTSLTSITIPDSVTSIGEYAFYDCPIEQATIPEFASNYINNSKLTNVVITSGDAIPDFAFSDYSRLTSITIPEGVTSIGEFAFYNCTSLTTVYYVGTQEQWNNISIGSKNSALTNATIVFNHPDHNYIPVVTAPTCTEQGYTTHTCHCGDSYVDTFVDIAPTAHSYTSVVTAPTCTEQGYTTYTCHCGDSYVDAYVDATGHSHEAVVTAPTCTSQGYTTHTCSNCGDSYVAAYVDALGHDEIAHDVKLPTCTEIGWDTYVTCSRCDYTTYSEIPARGHNYTLHIITSPTCTEQGYTAHTCSSCGDVCIDSYVDALGHDEIKHEGQTPTCEQGGWADFETCTRCNYSTYQPIPAAGHNYESVVIPPTCTTQGYTDNICNNCGSNYFDSYVDATGHPSVSWIIDIEPTCKSGGLKHQVCDTCGGIVASEIINALGHSYDAVVVEPTCTAQGYTTYTCNRCGDIYQGNFVDVTGHTWIWVIDRDSTYTETGIKHQKCSVCGATQVENTEIPIKTHDHNYESEVTTNPTCTQNGVETFTCSICNDTYTNDISATGHSSGSSKITLPTCTEQGYTTHTCSICGDSYVDSYVDSLGGHTFNKGLCFCGAHIGIDDSNYGYVALCSNSDYLVAQNIYEELWNACIDVVNSDITYDESNSALLQLDIEGDPLYYISKAFVAFLLDNPEFFFVSNTIYYENGLYSIKMDETYFDGEYRNYLIDVMDSYRQEVANLVSDVSSINEKINIIQKFIVDNVQYEFDEQGNPSTESHAHNIIGFHEKNGVCETYSKTFKFFCDYLNIENIIVMGKATNGENHSWNLVAFEEGYSFSDLTFYDSAMEEYYLRFSDMGTHIDSVFGPQCSLVKWLYPLPYGDYQGMLKLYKDDTFITSSDDLDELFEKMTDVEGNYLIKMADGVPNGWFAIHEEKWPTCKSISFIGDAESQPWIYIQSDLTYFTLHSDLFIKDISVSIRKYGGGSSAVNISTLDLNGHNLTIDSTYQDFYADIVNSSEKDSTIYTYASYNEEHENYVDGGPWLYGNIDCENFIAYGFVRTFGSLNVDFLEAHKQISLLDNEQRAIDCNIEIGRFVAHDFIRLKGLYLDSVYIDTLVNEVDGYLNIPIQGMVISNTDFTINTIEKNTRVHFSYASYEVHVSWTIDNITGDLQFDFTQTPDGIYIVYFPLKDVECFIKTEMEDWDVSLSISNYDGTAEHAQLSYDKDGYYFYSE